MWNTVNVSYDLHKMEHRERLEKAERERLADKVRDLLDARKRKDYPHP